MSCQNCGGKPIGPNGVVCDVCEGTGLTSIQKSTIEYDGPVLLVCGGRDFKDTAFAYKVLDPFAKKFPDLIIMTGSCEGADLMAEEWARKRDLMYMGLPAKWGEFPYDAGSRRNKRMLYCYRPNFVLALPGGPGTANMVRIAEKNGTPVIDYRIHG